MLGACWGLIELADVYISKADVDANASIPYYLSLSWHPCKSTGLFGEWAGSNSQKPHFKMKSLERLDTVVLILSLWLRLLYEY